MDLLSDPGKHQHTGIWIMRKWSVAIIGLFVLIYIVPLGVRPVANPDEVRYAEIPREMIVSGNWIAPHLNGVRYFEKPVLGYWLDAISMIIFGENGFAMLLCQDLNPYSQLEIDRITSSMTGGYKRHTRGRRRRGGNKFNPISITFKPKSKKRKMKKTRS